jgi:membrane protein DedA with SNARE-associated domain
MTRVPRPQVAICVRLAKDDRRADGGSGINVEEFLRSAGYGAIFALSFISSMGLPVGAEIALIYGGVLASGQIQGIKPLQLAVVIIVAILGELLGSAAGYAIGRFGGRPLVDRVGKYVLLTHKDLDRAEAWFARRGEPVVLFGRFIPLLRSFVSFAAGLGEMALPKFALFTVIGCAVWCTALCSLGYSLGSSYNHVLKAFSFAGYVLGALAVVAVAFVIWHRVRQLRHERDLGQADNEV